MQDFFTESSQTPSAITIGVFDGVHLGHQALLSATSAEAVTHGLHSVAISMHPRARDVLGKGEPSLYVSTLVQRVRLIRQQGLDQVVVLRFSREVAGTSARDFVTDLVSRYGMSALFVGSDFALGRGREGNVHFLRALGDEMGFDVRTVPPVLLDGERVSTSRVQAGIAAGDADLVSRLLGRRFALAGPVVEGFRRGRTLGFPTANVALPLGQIAPADGVYAVQCRLLPPGGDTIVVDGALAGDVIGAPCDSADTFEDGAPVIAGVASVGTRPTFDSGPRRLEVYLLDFDDDIYGRCLRVEFVRRLRPELHFDSVGDLLEQMRRDVDESRAILAVAGGDRG